MRLNLKIFKNMLNNMLNVDYLERDLNVLLTWLIFEFIR